MAELGAAYRQWGFAGIRNHGIPQADIDAAYDAFKAFFALPEEVKRSTTWPAAAALAATPRSGWRPPRAPSTDLKEFWHIGREIADDQVPRCDGAEPVDRGRGLP